MEEAPDNGKESSHFAHANGMNEWLSCQNTSMQIHKFIVVLNPTMFVFLALQPIVVVFLQPNSEL
jgi:hypothetical protein